MKLSTIAMATGLVLFWAATAGVAEAQKEPKPGAERAAPQRSAPRVERPASRVERAPRVERAQRAERRPQRLETKRAEPRERIKRAEPRQQIEKRAQRPQKGPERAERKREQLPKQATPQRKEGPAQKQAQTPDRQQVNRLQATNDQRVHVRQEILRGKIDRISRREFRGQLAVGAHIDRRYRHHLHRLTPAILAIVPIYAGYSYLVVDDDICIVDPETYAVVDFIPADGQYAYGSGPSRVQLRLTEEEMRFIYANAPRDQIADVRVRLALGAEVPSRVDLLGFPPPIIDRLPQLETFRYIVVEDDIVIVDPKDRSVSLVITE